MGYTEAGIRRVENLVRTLKKRNDELEAQLQQAQEEHRAMARADLLANPPAEWLEKRDAEWESAIISHFSAGSIPVGQPEANLKLIRARLTPKPVERVTVAEEVKISVPRDLLNRICGMVYATRGEQHRLNYVTDDEYGKLVGLRHGGHDSIETVLTALNRAELAKADDDGK